MLLQGHTTAAWMRWPGSAAWDSASSTSSQGDSVPQGLECQPATADGVGEDGPPVTCGHAHILLFSQHPLLSQRALF